MQKLQTRVNIPTPNFNIDYTQNISLFGSCFSDNIGNKLKRFKFNADVNPFGVLYNPASISQSINSLFKKANFNENELSFFNEQWFSFSHHSSFSNINKVDCLNHINHRFIESKEQLKNSNIVFITLGTAWVYRHKKTNSIVANCHKIPAKEFTREFLETTTIVDLLKHSIEDILSYSPNANIVFTVSPIRHWKDGAIENMRSKASLILAIKELQNLFTNCYYFPAYEIFMDELRDYRFYASDMLHPSDFSIDYIWDIFKQTFFSDKTITVLKQVDKIVKSFEHRTFNTNTEAFKSFAGNLISNTENFEMHNPGIHFSKEKEELLKLIWL